ncbi:hypothetical protein P148_SR1C00001G0574 [candidate division SR1 bacterium RAAC1_SR1_1]|nr:hypothetical protein P148_SR1C00001G0574 [candidate division SR1 bacterium RAAC1_SR1_1]
MVQFAVQRKFTKQKSVSPSLSSGTMIGKKAGGYLRKIPVLYFWIFFGILVFFYGGFLLLKYTIFVPEYRIGKIDYARSSAQIYDDPYLYKSISSLIKGENFYLISWNTKTIIQTIKKEYPFVQDIIIVYKAPKTVLVKVLFSPPELIMLHENKKFGVYKEHLFELFSGNSLGNSGVVKLEVLSFNSGGALTGIFFLQPTADLMDDIQLIKEAFPDIQKLSYLPGGHRMIVHLGNNKKIYINNAIPIQPQIINYQLLKKYYSEFELLKEIDLGSLESDKIIVKK